MKSATSNLAKRWGLPRPIITSHAEEKNGRGHGLGKIPNIVKSPFNISSKTEASDFKFGTQLGFAKAHHKITLSGKSGRGHRLGKLPKILGFPFNISATAEASDFKSGMLVWFAKAHHKIIPRGKSGRGPGLGELPKILGFPFNFLQRLKLATSNLVCCLGLPRPNIKLHLEEKWA